VERGKEVMTHQRKNPKETNKRKLTQKVESKQVTRAIVEKEEALLIK